jgi:DNA-binding beta-propeller fold protein YncE
MNCRRLLFHATVAALFLSRLAFSQVNGVEVSGGKTAQVFGGKSPLVQVADPEGKILASIPIGENPGTFVYSESANTLYVVHNEKKGEHFISAVNLTANRVQIEIPVGAGEIVELLVSSDGRRLFAYTAVKVLVNGGTFFYDEGVSFYNKNRCLLPPHDPKITAIDTSSNEVVANYDWFDSFTADSGKNVTFANQLLAADHQGKLVIWSETFWRKELSEKLVVFSGGSSKPVFMADTLGYVAAAMFSQDEKLLFVAIRGDKKTDGSLAVLNLEKGTIVNHALTDNPPGFSASGRNGSLGYWATKRCRLCLKREYRRAGAFLSTNR